MGSILRNSSSSLYAVMKKVVKLSYYSKAVSILQASVNYNLHLQYHRQVVKELTTDHLQTPKARCFLRSKYQYLYIFVSTPPESKETISSIWNMFSCLYQNNRYYMNIDMNTIHAIF